MGHQRDTGEEGDVGEVEHEPPANVEEIDNAAGGKPIGNVGDRSTDDQASGDRWVEAAAPADDGDTTAIAPVMARSALAGRNPPTPNATPRLWTSRKVSEPSDIGSSRRVDDAHSFDQESIADGRDGDGEHQATASTRAQFELCR